MCTITHGFLYLEIMKQNDQKILWTFVKTLEIESNRSIGKNGAFTSSNESQSS